MKTIRQIHEAAVQCAKSFRRSESALLAILIEVEDGRVFEALGYSSLHRYCVDALSLTDAQSYNFIGVARKSKEVPELKTLIDEGNLHLTNARRIVPVLTPDNKNEWLEKAQTLSQRELERELVKSHPEKVVRESIRPVTETRLAMKVMITPEVERGLKRMQDILSQKLKKPCRLEDVLEFMTTECLSKHDPVQKAERAKLVAQPVQVPAKADGERKPVPAAIRHAVNQRDQGRCTFTQADGKRCDSHRWVEAHHRIPVSQGGSHSINNLTTLCFTHHRFLHSSRRPHASTDRTEAWTTAR